MGYDILEDTYPINIIFLDDIPNKICYIIFIFNL